MKWVVQHQCAKTGAWMAATRVLTRDRELEVRLLPSREAAIDVCTQLRSAVGRHLRLRVRRVPDEVGLQ